MKPVTTPCLTPGLGLHAESGSGGNPYRPTHAALHALPYFDSLTKQRAIEPSMFTEMVTRRPFDSLELMLSKGWLRREQDVMQMPFIGALSGKSENFRPMPPAPDRVFAETEPQLFRWLMDWAEGLD